MNKWKKTGLVFCPNNHPKMVSHASMPTPLLLDDRVRIFFTSRDADNRSFVFYLDVSRSAPGDMVAVCDEPVLSPGKTGQFDDNGVQPNCAIRREDGVYLYYMGLSPGTTVATRNNTGLAISSNDGGTFERAFQGPVLDRTPLEPHFAFTPWVIEEDDGFKAWYASATEWVEIDGKPESLFKVKFASSKDGVIWDRPNLTCIEPENRMAVNCRPTVIKDAGKYKMWFSYRGVDGFRDGKNAYRIGYAVSSDGLYWERNDQLAGIDVSESGWDSEIICFCSVIPIDGKLHMYYVGNGFGATGFGHAEMPLNRSDRH